MRGRSFWNRLSPPQLFVLSFLVLVLIGTLGFQFLPGLYTGRSLNWLESVFTATSAVCVTGLIVVDTSEFFSFWGQLYLLLLIQLGGLGMIAFASTIIVALGRRISLQQESLTLPVEAVPQINHRQLIKDVAVFTFTIEGIGAVLLYLSWISQLGFVGAIWPAIFHSVSAFCNAGFSTFGNSLMDMQRNPFCIFIISGLIITGGLGLLTSEEIRQAIRSRSQDVRYRPSLHSRLVIWTTIVLLFGAWPLFTFLEWNASLKTLPVFDKLTNGFFLSVTARTAGFNSVDYSKTSEPTCFLTILLMTIGGSPGSTAGGMKTTTFAMLGLVAWSRMRGLRTTTVWNRSIREETTNRTIGLVVIAIGVVILASLLLTILEFDPLVRGYFLGHLFEVVSAFNTVGLSMGITPTDKYRVGSQILLIFLMFVGRVGPLTFASAMAVRYAKSGNFRYAYEDVTVG